MYSYELEDLIKRDGEGMRRLFLGIYARDTLPKNGGRSSGGYILNTDYSGSEGEHWILVYIDRGGGGEVISFDCYAKAPDYYGREFSHWLKDLQKGGELKRVRVNSQVIQSAKSELCGLFCIYAFYHLVRGYSLEAILKVFKEDFSQNDKIVIDFAWRKLNFNAYEALKKKHKAAWSTIPGR